MGFQNWLFALAISVLTSGFSTVWAQKQSKLEGEWTGIVTQEDPDGPVAEYQIRLRIVREGKRLKGQSTVVWGDKSAKIWFKGKVERQVLVLLEETEFIEKSELEDTWDWCLKNMTLVLKEKENKAYLEGYWTGKSKFGPCKPGKILVEKPLPRV